jgi:hypothetical protein
MANAQAVLMFELEPAIPFTVADGASIEKGDFLQLTTPMTASLVDGDDDIACGIAAEEKIANDGKTKIGVYRRGIFKVEAGTSGATAGKDGVCEAKNELKDYDSLDDEIGKKFGKFLESGNDGKFVAFELQVA